jgi:nucleoside-diphosphate-sugar epimerase
VIARHYPDARPILARFAWRLPTHIDRVYVIDKAIRDLGFKPRKNFRQLLEDVVAGTQGDPKTLAHLRSCA